jgi:hypothetical protein
VTFGGQTGRVAPGGWWDGKRWCPPDAFPFKVGTYVRLRNSEGVSNSLFRKRTGPTHAHRTLKAGTIGRVVGVELDPSTNTSYMRVQFHALLRPLEKFSPMRLEVVSILEGIAWELAAP